MFSWHIHPAFHRHNNTDCKTHALQEDEATTKHATLAIGFVQQVNKSILLANEFFILATESITLQ